MNPGYYNETVFPNQTFQCGQTLDWSPIPTQQSQSPPVMYSSVSPVLYPGETSFQFGNESNNNNQPTNQGYIGGYAPTQMPSPVQPTCVSPVGRFPSPVLQQNIASYQPFSSPQQMVPWNPRLQKTTTHQSFPDRSGTLYSTPPPCYSPRSPNTGGECLISPSGNPYPTENLQPDANDDPKEIKEITRKFASVLQKHGSMKSTDTRIMNTFIKLTPKERRLVMMRGNILAFLNNSEYIKAVGSTLLLVKSPDDESEDLHQTESTPKIETQATEEDPKEENTPRESISFEKIAASHNITVEKSPECDDKEKIKKTEWLSPQFDRGDPVLLYKGECLQSNPAKISFSSSSAAKRVEMSETLDLIKEKWNKTEDEKRLCPVPLGEIGKSDFEENLSPKMFGNCPVPLLKFTDESDELMPPNLRENLQERIQINLGESEDENSCDNSIDESVKDNIDNKMSSEEVVDKNIPPPTPPKRPIPLRMPTPAAVQQSPTIFNPNVVEFRPRGVFMTAPPFAYKKKTCQEASVQTEDKDVKTIATGMKQIKLFTSCMMTDSIDTREVAINTTETLFEDTAGNIQGPLLIPRKDEGTLAKIKPDSCDIGTEVQPVTCDIATMTEPNEVVESVDSLQYEEALERARNAEEKVLTLQAQMCNTELLTLSLQINMQYQPNCRSPAETSLCNKILQDLQAEINRIEKLYLFNLVALKNGELLSQLEPIEMLIPEGLEELKNKQQNVMSNNLETLPAAKQSSLPASPQKPPRNIPNNPHSLPTSPLGSTLKASKVEGLPPRPPTFNHGQVPQHASVKSSEGSTSNSIPNTNTEGTVMKTNVQNTEKIVVPPESTIGPMKARAPVLLEEQKVVDIGLKQLATNVPAADTRRRYNSCNSEIGMKSSGSESGLGEEKKKKKGRKKGASGGIITRAKLQEIIDQEKKSQEMNASLQGNQTNSSKNHEEKATTQQSGVVLTAPATMQQQHPVSAATGDGTVNPIELQQTMFYLAQSDPVLATNPALLQSKALQQMAAAPKNILQGATAPGGRQEADKITGNSGDRMPQQNPKVSEIKPEPVHAVEPSPVTTADAKKEKNEHERSRKMSNENIPTLMSLNFDSFNSNLKEKLPQKQISCSQSKFPKEPSTVESKDNPYAVKESIGDTRLQCGVTRSKNVNELPKPQAVQKEIKSDRCNTAESENWEEETDDFPQPFKLGAYNSSQQIRAVPQKVENQNEDEDVGEWQIVGQKTRENRPAAPSFLNIPVTKPVQKFGQKRLPLTTKSVPNSQSQGRPIKSGNPKPDSFKPLGRVPDNISSTKGKMSGLEEIKFPGAGTENETEEWQEVKTKKSKNVNIAQPRTESSIKYNPPKVVVTSQDKERKMSNFERLINRLMSECPGTDRQGAIQLITEVRDLNHGLQGIPMAKIVSDAILITEKRKVQKMTKLEPKLALQKGNVSTQSKFAALMNYPPTPQPGSAYGTDVLSDEDINGEICVICCDPIPENKGKALECGHEFHLKCIMRWLVGEERTCPTCRRHALLAEDFPKLCK